MKENERNKRFSAITEKDNNQISLKKQLIGEENYKAFQYKIPSRGNNCIINDYLGHGMEFFSKGLLAMLDYPVMHE